MVDKQVVLNRAGDEDFLSDDDPFAELARIAGIERPSTNLRSAQDAKPEPEFDLEDELLREFELYDLPRPDDLEREVGPGPTDPVNAVEDENDGEAVSVHEAETGIANKDDAPDGAFEPSADPLAALPPGEEAEATEVEPITVVDNALEADEEDNFANQADQVADTEYSVTSDDEAALDIYDEALSDAPTGGEPPAAGIERLTAEEPDSDLSDLVLEDDQDEASSSALPAEEELADQVAHFEPEMSPSQMVADIPAQNDDWSEEAFEASADQLDEESEINPASDFVGNADLLANEEQFGESSDQPDTQEISFSGAGQQAEEGEEVLLSASALMDAEVENLDGDGGGSDDADVDESGFEIAAQASDAEKIEEPELSDEIDDETDFGFEEPSEPEDAEDQTFHSDTNGTDAEVATPEPDQAQEPGQLSADAYADIEEDLTKWDPEQAFAAMRARYVQPEFDDDGTWGRIAEEQDQQSGTESGEAGSDQELITGEAAEDETAGPGLQAVPADVEETVEVVEAVVYDDHSATQDAPEDISDEQDVEPETSSADTRQGSDDWALDDEEPAMPDLDAPDFGIDELLAEVERYPIPSTGPDWVRPEVSRASEKMPMERFDADALADRGKELPEDHSDTDARSIDFDADLSEMEVSDTKSSDWEQGDLEDLAGGVESSVDDDPNFGPETGADESFSQSLAAVEEIDLSDEENPFDDADFELDIGAIERDLHATDDHGAEDALADEADAVENGVQPVASMVSSGVAAVSGVGVSQASAADVPPGLHFDPEEITENADPVTLMADIDVPVLPVDNKEAPAAVTQDFDLDIDAEMARMFSRTDQASAGIPTPVVDRQSSANPSPGAYIASDSIDDFERALEDDFRRSMTPEKPTEKAPDRVRLRPGENFGLEDDSRGSRRGIFVGASALVIVLLAGAGVYAWMNKSDTATASNEGPRIILADKDPVKIVPENKGGQTVPNQDKAVYDKVAGAATETPKQEVLVSSTEEPVDVVQKTLIPDTIPLDEDVPTATSTDDTKDPRLLPGEDKIEPVEETNPVPGVQPRKVRTMIVKPDGTLVAREEIVTEPEAASDPAGEALKAADTATADESQPADETAIVAEDTASPAADNQVSAAETEVLKDMKVETPAVATDEQQQTGTTADTPADQTALAAAAETEVQADAPVRVVKTSKITKNAPVPENRPVDQPVNVVNTVTDQGTVKSGDATGDNQTGQQVASAEQSTATTTSQLPEGTYVIQIASLPSEAEAQRSYKNLSGKFASVIGGKGVDIKRAEISGKGTYYRVRIPAGTKDDAISLCTKYKKAGGSCLVSR